MWSNVVILTAIVAPLVLIGAWLFLRHVDRATEGEATKLAAKCKCPKCSELTLKWDGELWGEDVLYDDREDHFSGYTLKCSRCYGQYQFTASGEVYVPATGARPAVAAGRAGVAVLVIRMSVGARPAAER
jgi:hypothetical protein